MDGYQPMHLGLSACSKQPHPLLVAGAHAADPLKNMQNALYFCLHRWRKIDRGTIPHRLRRVLSKTTTGNIGQIHFMIWEIHEKSLQHSMHPKCSLEAPAAPKTIRDDPRLLTDAQKT